MANDTKDRILDAALEMFSKNGYAGTNIRELSAALGLVKSGIYKHFESKEDIWNALLDRMIVPVISEIESSLFSGVYFWKIDSHLSTEGVRIRTDRIIEDLRPYIHTQIAHAVLRK